MLRFSNIEPLVWLNSPMPKGYVFVPKGSLYITGNCRRKTQARHQTVYVVVDANKKPIGIRVPAAIHRDVLKAEAETRQERAAVIQKRDSAMEREFRDAVVKTFPKIPIHNIPRLITRTMQKGSNRVGRTGTLTLTEKAELAVRAHIRHCYTDYDRLMNTGVKQSNARTATSKKVEEMMKEWGWRGRGRKERAEAEHASSCQTGTQRGPANTKVGENVKTIKKLQKCNKEGKPRDTAIADSEAKKNRKKSKRARQRERRRLAKAAQAAQSAQAIRSTQLPKDRRHNKMRLRQTGGTLLPSNSAASTANGVGISLQDDTEEVYESDEYVESSDFDEDYSD
ncbi:hypothetical protein BX600DRAFT_88166 [Xylariales sp. PMI_506]|nr:hypothetical protein BX600DRAFT_88166 [Xylariales sp. PMI_506]